MSFFDMLARMLVILFAVALGYLSRRLGYLGGEVDQKLCKLLLNVTLPVMILGSVATGRELPAPAETVQMLLVAAVFYAVEMLLVPFVPKLLGGTPQQKGVWRYAAVFPNMAYIGYPVIVSIFGQEALLYGILLSLPFNLLSYTLGPLMIAGQFRISWKQFASPAVLASVVALIVTLTGFRVPPLAGEMLNFVGDVSVPMSLMVVGSLLAGLPVKKAFLNLRLWGISAIRLLLLPAVLWLILKTCLNLPPLMLNIAVIQMGMPVAITGSMLCLEYGGDAETMAQVTLMSTLLCMVTIPFLAAGLL